MKQIILDFGVLRIGDLTIPLRIYGYGLMLVIGFIVGVYLAQRKARRAGENADAISVCCILALVGGIVGSRIAYVVQHWDTQFASADNKIAAVANLTSGGLIYYGGVVLAIVLVVCYLLAKGLSVRRYLDFLAVSMMVGLAFGRTGCLLNGCCYGGRCDEHWPIAMRFPMYSRPLIKLDGRDNPYSEAGQTPSPAYSHHLGKGWVHPHPKLVDPEGQLLPPNEFDEDQAEIAGRTRALPVHPAQALGIFNALLIAVLVACFYRIRRREGQAFAVMLMAYAVSRFALESIRDDNPHDLLAGVFTHNQYTSTALFFAGMVMLVVVQCLPRSAGPAWAIRQAEAVSAHSANKVKHRNSKRR